MGKTTILIVEDEFIIAEDTQETLIELGYDVIGNVRTYDDAMSVLKNKVVNIALIDINLNDEKNGVDVATQIKEQYHIPFIFVTSYADKATVDKAKSLKPNGYLVKPFDKKDLYTSIEIALSNFTTNVVNVSPPENVVDYIFIKDGTTQVKLKFTDLLFLKSEANYVAIKTEHKIYLVRKSLKEFLTELPQELFMQTHKSYIVNSKHIGTIQAHQLIIHTIEIPIGREFKELVLKRLNFV